MEKGQLYECMQPNEGKIDRLQFFFNEHSF